MKLLSIVVPAYNEAQRIPATLHDIQTYLAQQIFSAEIVVVDDGSTDGTAELVQATFPDITVLLLAQNMGKGEAMRRGFFAAHGDYILFTDADGSTPIQEFDKMKSWLDRAPVLIGSRRVPGADIRVSQNPLKSGLGRLGNMIIRHALHLPYKDTQCGFKAFARSTAPVFEKLRIHGFGIDFELLARAQKEGFAIQEIPVTWYNSTASKVRTRDYLRTYSDLWRVRRAIQRDYA